MYFDSGIYKMITFGASITVDGNNKGVYCYKVEYNEKGATYKGVNTSWEQWTEKIKISCDIAREYKVNSEEYEQLYKEAERSIYYQYGTHLTVTAELNTQLKSCIYQYITFGTADFPEGEIPNADLTFTIDFDTDVELRKSHANTHNRDIKGRNEAFKKFSTLGATRGDIYTRKQLLELKFNDKNIRRYIDYGFMDSNGKGTYTILIEKLADLE